MQEGNKAEEGISNESFHGARQLSMHTCHEERGEDHEQKAIVKAVSNINGLLEAFLTEE